MFKVGLKDALAKSSHYRRVVRGTARKAPERRVGLQIAPREVVLAPELANETYESCNSVWPSSASDSSIADASTAPQLDALPALPSHQAAMYAEPAIQQYCMQPRRSKALPFAPLQAPPTPAHHSYSSLFSHLTTSSTDGSRRSSSDLSTSSDLVIPSASLDSLYSQTSSEKTPLPYTPAICDFMEELLTPMMQDSSVL